MAFLNFEQKVNNAMSRVVEASSEMEQAQTSQLKTNQGIAAEMQLSLRSMRDGDVSALLKMLGEMGGRLVCYALKGRKGNLLIQ